MTNRAFSLISVKSFDDDERVIEGLATSVEADRHGDVVEPGGVQFRLPLPLLLDHDHQRQVGHVTHAEVTGRGIRFRAQLAKIDEPGPAKELADQAWSLVKHKLRSAVSIGFRALKDGVERIESGLRFTSTEWLELSLVTIPANASATIWSTKKLDAAKIAALKEFDTGFNPPEPDADPRAIKVANIDREIARLESVKRNRIAELEADEQKHVLDQNTSLQGSLRLLVNAARDKIEKLLSERNKIEIAEVIGEDVDAPAQPVRSGQRQWEIKGLEYPDFPHDAANSGDKATVLAAHQSFELHGIDHIQKHLHDCGFDPDSPIKAQGLAMTAGQLLGHTYWLNELIVNLQERVIEIEARGVEYSGTYQRAMTYRRGQMVTSGGSIWAALQDVPENIQPGTSGKHWQLAVKAGKDASK